MTKKTDNILVHLHGGKGAISIEHKTYDRLLNDWVVSSFRNNNYVLKNLKTKAINQSMMHLMSDLLVTIPEVKNDPDKSMLLARAIATRLYPLNGQTIYAPGNPNNIIDIGNGQYCENIWRDNNVESNEKGDIQKVYVEHLENTIGKEEANYLLDLLAYQTQQHFIHRKIEGTKPQVAVVFASEAHGVGKGTFASHLQETLGNAVIIAPSPEAISFDKNAPSYWKASFLIVEEAETGTRLGKRFYKELKSKTGMDKFSAELKYQAVQEHIASAVPILSLNGNVGAILHWLPPTDRRVFVTKWQAYSEDKENQANYIGKLRKWWAENDGAGQLKHLLLTRDWKANGFSPVAHALRTDAFEEATNGNSDDIIDAIIDYIEEANSQGKRIFTTEDFGDIFRHYDISNNKIENIKLKEAGLVKTGRIQIPQAKQTKTKYWISSKDNITHKVGHASTINGINLKYALRGS